MNGTELNNLDWTPKEVLKKQKKQLYIRFILSLVLSNTLIAITFYQNNHDTQIINEFINGPKKENYTKIILPLDNYVHIQDQEVKISLFDQLGNPIIAEAFIISRINEADGQSMFILEIPINELIKIHSLKEQQRPLKSYPFNHTLTVGAKVYEIQF